MPINSLLTKSSFTHYLECPLKLWLEKVRPDLMPPITTELELLFEQGRLVDDLARQLHPFGTEIQGYNQEGFEHTKVALGQGARTLYQPTAVANGLSARADMLTPGQAGRWDMREVKMTTQVKDPDHIKDLAFQRLCFEAAGIGIDKTYLVHINNQYVRQGAVDIQALFIQEDVTADVLAALPAVQAEIPKAQEVLAWPKDLAAEHLMTCPDLAKCKWVGYWLDSLKPRALEKVLASLEPGVAAAMLEGEVFDITRLSAEFLKSIPYRPRQARWPLKIDKEAIRAELEALEYPLYYLDYETYGSPVPAFDGYRPYQQIPFQFSLSVQDSPGAQPQVHDFLMREFSDPSIQIIQALEQAIGPKGHLISWNASFEMGRNKDLAELRPEHADFLLDLNARMYDLMMPFKRKLYVHPDFRNSASIKKVLPVLIPDLSYDNLNIHQGAEASASWPIITDPKLPKAERDQLAAEEIEYCRLDVLAMVRILDHLRAVCAS